MLCSIVFVTILVTCSVTASDPALEEEEIQARAYIQLLNEKYAKRGNKVAQATWNYASNITEDNLKAQLTADDEAAKLSKEDWLETIKFNWHSFRDYDLHRQFKKYSKLDTAALSPEKFRKLNKVISDMQAIYATSKICDYRDKAKCNLELEPELTDILRTSNDPDELKHVWIQWRNKTKESKKLFKDYVDLSNEAARLNNFTDNAEQWIDDFEMTNFREQIKNLWEQVKPLYLQIHAYIRHQLRLKYGENIVSERGPIPAHLLGNMWAQTWSNIAKFTLPYPSAQGSNIDSNLLQQGYTPLKMFKLAEEFFVSLNLSAMPPLFWDKSIIEKPSDREMVCHASAWDFYDGEDFRIKQCTRINFEDLVTVHHEMGHIQYFLQYKDQPLVYREGANSGFHEAVGDVLALSVSTEKHLKKIGLLDEQGSTSQEQLLNNLFKIGLDKIVFLPFGYLMDQWRWDVFSGKISPAEYNCKWWQLRNDIQGIESPVDRSEEDFDPAAKYHIIANVPYVRYFVSFIIQFQFHRALCEKAGQYNPSDVNRKLSECDIYQSTEAGNALKNMLQMGSSRPWPDAMEVLTGQRQMDASGLLEYFRPLQKWLEEENKKIGAFIGWEASTKECVGKKEAKR